MKRYLLALLLVVPLIACAIPMDAIRRAKLATYGLTMKDQRFCTAVALSNHILVTATHCLVDLDKAGLDGKPSQFTLLSHDGADHAFIWSSRELRHWTKVGAKPKLGDQIITFGHPMGLPMLFRTGYMAGSIDDYVYEDIAAPLTLWDFEGFQGDSGGGVFNLRGELVATTSMIVFDFQSRLFRMMGSWDYAFTAKQLQATELPHTARLQKEA